MKIMFYQMCNIRINCFIAHPIELEYLEIIFYLIQAADMNEGVISNGAVLMGEYLSGVVTLSKLALIRRCSILTGQCQLHP